MYNILNQLIFHDSRLLLLSVLNALCHRFTSFDVYSPRTNILQDIQIYSSLLNLDLMHTSTLSPFQSFLTIRNPSSLVGSCHTGKPTHSTALPKMSCSRSSLSGVLEGQHRTRNQCSSKLCCASTEELYCRKM